MYNQNSILYNQNSIIQTRLQSQLVANCKYSLRNLYYRISSAATSS